MNYWEDNSVNSTEYFVTQAVYKYKTVVIFSKINGLDCRSLAIVIY
jgi:hypothetical protein